MYLVLVPRWLVLVPGWLDLLLEREPGLAFWQEEGLKEVSLLGAFCKMKEEEEAWPTKWGKRVED